MRVVTVCLAVFFAWCSGVGCAVGDITQRNGAVLLALAAIVLAVVAVGIK